MGYPVNVSPLRRELCTPDTLRVEPRPGTFAVLGGPGARYLLALFASECAANHFKRYCVEEQKTFEGVYE